MKNELRLYDTLTERVEPLDPVIPGGVGMYVCGPTVYGRAHIGNFRTFVATDVLRRTLKYFGYAVRHVMNFTDVEDRIIRFAQDASTDLEGFTAPHVAAFREDMALLRIEAPEVMPKATEHLPEMIALVDRLIARGHTYAADGSVYFRISSFPDYGRLSRLDVEGIRPGARIDNDRYDKENARDFVLWKLKTDEPSWAQWDAPFGRGRPGWHLECSAMSMKYLGETFDLHCGGIDLVFPHHENEIAQSSGGTGKQFAKRWMHVEHLLVNDETMSKSKGNFFTLPDVVSRGHGAEAVRYLLCQAHYRKKLNFTWEGLQHATAALERIHGFVRRLGEVERDGPAGDRVETVCRKWEEAFRAALADDLNTPEALAAVHGLVGEGNSLLAAGEVSREGAQRLRSALSGMDTVFAVLIPGEGDGLSSEERALFDERQEARRSKDYARADAARAKLESLGVVLEDTPKGTRWRRARDRR